MLVRKSLRDTNGFVDFESTKSGGRKSVKLPRTWKMAGTTFIIAFGCLPPNIIDSKPGGDAAS